MGVYFHLCLQLHVPITSQKKLSDEGYTIYTLYMLLSPYIMSKEKKICEQFFSKVDESETMYM